MKKGYNRYNHKSSSKLTPRQRQIIARKFGLVLSILITAFAIILTAGGASVKSKAADNYHKYYTSVEVMPGDTLAKYYREYGENYDNAREYINEVYMINDLTNDNIKAGSYIILPYYSTEVK